MARLTEWFGPQVKPTIPGVYATDASPFAVYQHWDGRTWGKYAGSPEGAANSKRDPSRYQRIKWRGLAEKPK